MLQVRVNTRTGRFVLKPAPLSAAKGDRAATLANQPQALEEQLNSCRAGELGNVIRKMVSAQKQLALLEAFHALAGLLYPTTLDISRSLPLEVS